MRARFVLTTLLSVFFALCSINVGFAQDRPVIIVSSSGGGGLNSDGCWDCFELDEGCRGFFKFHLQVANLELYVPNTNTPLNGDFYWPEALPDLYIQMKIGGVLQGTYFVDGAFNWHSNYNGYNVFRQLISLPADIEGLCGSDECVGVELSLVQLGVANIHKGGNKNKQSSANYSFTSYPVEDYAKPNEVFSSSVFSETCHLDDKNQNCKLFSTPDSYYASICCDDCLDDISTTSRTTTAESGSYPIEKIQVEGSLSHKKPLEQLSINPNPFQNQVVLKLGQQASDESVNLKVIDSMGRIVYHYTIEDGKEQHLIDSSQLQSGIYYFRIQIGESIRTQKLLKF